MAKRGFNYDTNIGLVLQNYLENRSKYFGIGNYNDAGFAFMEKGIAITLDTFKKSLKHKDLKIVYGTDANAGADGQNYREFIVRVHDGEQDPMQALISVTSLAAGRYCCLRRRSAKGCLRLRPSRVRDEGRQRLRERRARIEDRLASIVRTAPLDASPQPRGGPPADALTSDLLSK